MSRPKTRVPRGKTAHQSDTAPTPNTRLETTGQLTWLRVDRLSIDPAYQRPINETKVRAIARDFDPNAFGALYVSKRNDGSHVILDGQQRWNALIRMEWGDQKVPAVVYTGLTQPAEAALFRRYNELRTKPKPLDLHRAAIVERDKRALDIERVLKDHGLRFGSGGYTHGVVLSVGTVQTIYSHAGLSVLDRTFRLVLKAWGAGTEALHGDILTAVAVLLARHGNAIDEARLVRVLGRIDPGGIVRKARVIKSEMGLAVTGGHTSPIGGLTAALILQEYNRRLPEADRVIWDHDATGAKYWKPRS